MALTNKKSFQRSILLHKCVFIVSFFLILSACLKPSCAADIRAKNGYFLYKEPDIQKGRDGRYRFKGYKKDKNGKDIEKQEVELKKIGGIWRISAPKNKSVTITYSCTKAASGSRELKPSDSWIAIADPRICPEEPQPGLGIPKNNEILNSQPLVRSRACTEEFQDDDALTKRTLLDHHDIPHIITPRYTLVSNKRPSFTWRAIKGAVPHQTLYKVTLYRIERGECKTVWTYQSSYNVPASGKVVETFPYPNEEVFGLESGVAYKPIIEVICSSPPCPSSEDEEQEKNFKPYWYTPQPRSQFPISGLTFEVINNVSLEYMVLNNLKQENNSKVDIYHKAYLYAEAIEIIEGSVSQESNTYSLLSDIYVDIGLKYMAINALQRGLEFTTIQARKNKEYATQLWIKKLNEKLKILCKGIEPQFNDLCISINDRKDYQGFPINVKLDQ
jgi:hypothetical protein